MFYLAICYINSFLVMFDGTVQLFVTELYQFSKILISQNVGVAQEENPPYQAADVKYYRRLNATQISRRLQAQQTLYQSCPVS